VDSSRNLSYNAYAGMVNLIGIDRVLFTTDYPYATMKAACQYLDQMPINLGDKEKIAHLNAERLLGLKGSLRHDRIGTPGSVLPVGRALGHR